MQLKMGARSIRRIFAIKNELDEGIDIMETLNCSTLSNELRDIELW